MAAALGSDGSVRVKSEATPGAAPAGGFFVVPVTGFEMIPKVGNRTKSATLGAFSAAINAAFRSPIGCEGFFETEGDYNGAFDWLFLAHLGAEANTGDGATDPFTNVYTPSSTPPTFHIEYVAGDIPSGKCYRYQNILVPELTITGDANGKITARARLVAEKEASASGGDTPTSSGLVTPAGVPINTAPDATKWNIGVGADTDYCVRRFTLNSRRPLAPPRACFGSTFYKAPTYVGSMEGDYEFEVEFEDELAYRAFIAGDAITDIEMEWVGGTVLTGSYTLRIRVNLSDYDEAGPPKWDTNGALSILVKGTFYGNSGTGAATAPWTATTINLIDGDVL